ncbi:MAG: hypothetical protein EXR95_01840 [Gemmatimonadetes bacterium]|nr:hypothetical protein [Gemmatimonadota bacterium]
MKDGFPFPVDRATYDRTITWLRDAVDRAKVGHSERLHALRRRLQGWVERRPERRSGAASLP